MSVALLIEADYPKDEERDKKRVKLSREVLMPYYEKMVEEKDIKRKMSIWSDNTGYVVALWEFETMEDLLRRGATRDGSRYWLDGPASLTTRESVC